MKKGKYSISKKKFLSTGLILVVVVIFWVRVSKYQEEKRLKISDLQPIEISQSSLSTRELERYYDRARTIVKWDLVVDDSHESFTDVIGVCNWWVKISPLETRNLPINVRFAGKDCSFWKDIRKGDSITVIGEVAIREWVISTDPYETEVTIDITPLAVKHNQRLLIEESLPRQIRNQLLSLLR